MASCFCVLQAAARISGVLRLLSPLVLGWAHPPPFTKRCESLGMEKPLDLHVARDPGLGLRVLYVGGLSPAPCLFQTD